MLVQRFQNGNSPAIAADAFDSVFAQYVDRIDDEHDCFHITARDGGQAEIYVGPAGYSMNSLMVSRFSAGQVLDLVVEFVRRADAVIMPPGCPTLIVHEEQRRHLPAQVAGQVAMIRNGADVYAVLAGNWRPQTQPVATTRPAPR
jgi:hypothetical protein